MKTVLLTLFAIVAPVLLALPISACGARQTAADIYSAKLKACNDVNTSPASKLDCIHQVQAQYDEAGAPPATVLEGGR